LYVLQFRPLLLETVERPDPPVGIRLGKVVHTSDAALDNFLASRFRPTPEWSPIRTKPSIFEFCPVSR
jgi:hypothetical protein